MFLRKICIENYRLLKNVEIDLDKLMTVFVGKNNTGKTSVMRFMQEVLGNKSSLSIDDYSLGCHSILHEKVKEFWNNDCACEQDFWDDLPLIKMRMYIDYEQESSEESLGALSDFILDLNDKERTAVIDVNFDVSLNIGDTLKLCKAEYDNGITDSNVVSKSNYQLQNSINQEMTDIVKSILY